MLTVRSKATLLVFSVASILKVVNVCSHSLLIKCNPSSNTGTGKTIDYYRDEAGDELVYQTTYVGESHDYYLIHVRITCFQNVAETLGSGQRQSSILDGTGTKTCFEPEEGFRRILEILTDSRIKNVRNLTISREWSPSLERENVCDTSEEFSKQTAGSYQTHPLKNILDSTMNLTALHLNYIRLEKLPRSLFQNTSTLRVVDFRNNSLRTLPDEIFQPLRNSLVRIQLSNNLLVEVNENLFANLIHLRELDISGNQLKAIQWNFLRDSNGLEKLNLSGNECMELSDNFCVGSPHLHNLSLANNQLNMQSQTDSYFSILRKCTSLKYIDLRNNIVPRIFMDWTKEFPGLQNIDLSHNNFSHKLQIGEDLMNPNYKYAPPLTIKLDENRINAIEFLERMNLEACPPKHAKNANCRQLQFSLPNISIDCNETINFDFIRFVQDASDFRLKIMNVEELRCSLSSGDWSNRPLQNVDLWEFYTAGPKECPQQCSCKTRMIDNATQISNCTGLPLSLPYNTGELILSGNDLRNDISHISELMKGLEGSTNLSLDLSRTNLEDISDLEVTPPLKVLHLDRNNLTVLPEKLLEHLKQSKISVSLADNPWKCTCDGSLVKFVQNSTYMVYDRAGIKCANQNDTLMGQIKDEALCYRFPWREFMVVLLSIVGLFGVLISISVKYSYEMKVLWGKYGMYQLQRRKDKDPHEMNRELEHDACVIHSQQDDYVVEHLTRKLRGYSFCVPERDWEAGAPIRPETHRSIERSRGTIVIVSRNFFEESEEASLRMSASHIFRIAHRQMWEERRAHVIVILLEDVSSHKVPFPELRAYLRTRTYLRWKNTAWFWNKLRYEIDRLPGRINTVANTESIFLAA